MDDLRQRFTELDRIEAPDVWGDGSTRTPRPEETPTATDRRPRQRLIAAVVAFGVFIAAGVFAYRAFETSPPGGTASPTASTDPAVSIDVGWTRLPSPPATLPGATTAWAGGELLSWGGAAPKSEDYAPSATGYAFDPAAGSWTAMPPAPIPGKYAEAVWTGTEVLLLGVGTDLSRWQGEAFDPATDTWRVIAAPPFDAAPAVLVWTGRDLIGWGGGSRGEPSNVRGAAYDPVADSWHRIADAPIGLNAADGVWTGELMLVFGSLLDGGNHAATAHAVGETYDPVADSWHEIAPSDLSPQASAAVWVDDRMVAYDYGWKAARYDAGADSWEPLDGLPFSSGECYPDGAVVAGEVFAFGCGEAATLSSGGRAWNPVHGGMVDATVQANDQSYQLWRFATLIPAGPVLFLAAEGVTVSEEGVPCYGCSGSQVSFWAYRPA